MSATFGVWGLGVWDSGCRVQGAGLRIPGLDFGGSEFRIEGSGFRILEQAAARGAETKSQWLGLSGESSGLRDQGYTSRFRVWSSGLGSEIRGLGVGVGRLEFGG